MGNYIKNLKKVLKGELNHEVEILRELLLQQADLLREIKELTLDNNAKIFRNDWEPNQNIRQKMYDIARIEAAEYVLSHMSKVKAFNVPLDILTYAISQVTVSGQYLEFGVFSGKTINHMAQTLPEEVFYGFDCFEGLPETWRTGYEEGTFKVDVLPKVESNVQLVKGLFSDTLPAFCKEHTAPCALIHIDCDLYSSTVCVLEELKNQIVEGTIIVFDEYFNYPGWKRDGEYRAFQEFVDKYHIKYEYIGYVEILEQVAVRIIS